MQRCYFIRQANHHHRHRATMHHIPCDAAKHQVVQFTVPVSPHNDEVERTADCCFDNTFRRLTELHEDSL